MSTLADLRPGDIMFARHVSPRAVDLLILAGQLALGEPGWPHHVGVVTEAIGPWDGPHIVQAMPRGAEEIEIGPEHWTKDYTYLRPAYSDDPSWDRFGTGDTQANAVARHAHGYVGTPYSFLDYASLAAHHFHAPGSDALRDYVKSTGHMICSQLADRALSDAGFHVFDDERWPGDVTPAALYTALRAMPGTQVIGAG